MNLLPAPVTGVITVITTPEVDQGYAVLIQTLRQLHQVIDEAGSERHEWHKAFPGNPHRRAELAALARAYEQLNAAITSLTTANRSARLALVVERERRRRGRGFDLFG